MESMYDLVYSEYLDEDNALIEEFRLAMQIITTGVHHTGLIAMVVDKNPVEGAITNALQGVVMKIVELDFVATSDINGLCGIAKIKPGTYHVEFVLTGYVTRTLILGFIRGRMMEMEVEMEKV
ncbi:MAG: hypothetical protein WCQ95_11335 [Bacteroidota bacterium]